MEISILLIRQIISLMLIGIAGYWLRKMDFITHEGCKGLTAVCVYICMPCTLFSSSQVDLTPERVNGYLYAIVAIVLMHVLFFSVMRMLYRPFSFSVIERNSVIYSNAGNLIIPLVTGVFGAEYVFYTGAYLMIQNLLLWTHAVTVIGGKVTVRKLILHPCMLAILSGILFMLMEWRLPDVVVTAMFSLSGCIGPISMLVVGILIAEINLREILENSRIYLVSLFRLIGYPCIAILAAWIVRRFWPVEVDQYVYLIAVLGACGPTATTITQMAQLYDNDPGYASSINILTTIGSMMTVPLMMTAAQLWI